MEFTEHEVSIWTYRASDMCLSPANTTGFWKPGNIHDAVLKGLEPNTRYFYSYGSEGVRNNFDFFFWPVRSKKYVLYQMFNPIGGTLLPHLMVL